MSSEGVQALGLIPFGEILPRSAPLVNSLHSPEFLGNLSDISLVELKTDCEWEPEPEPEKPVLVVSVVEKEIEPEKEKSQVTSGSRWSAPRCPRRKPKK